MAEVWNTINPTTGLALNSWPTHSPQQVDSLLNAMVVAQAEWAQQSLSQRQSHIRNVAHRLSTATFLLAEEMVREIGKPLSQAIAEIEKCAKTLEVLSDLAPEALADELVSTEAKDSRIRYRPLGIVFGVMPWNFPYWQAIRILGPALLAGNGFIIKPSSISAGTTNLLLETIADALPKNLIGQLRISADYITKLVEDPRIAAVTLTGSERAGAAVAAAAGRALKPCVLELGGSDPFIVLDDADLSHTIPIALQSRIRNNGQSCIAAKRFFIQDSILHSFTKQFSEALSQLEMGDPFLPSTELGPLVSSEQRSGLHQQVLRSLEQGAKCHLGGKLPTGPGYFYPPTLLSGGWPDAVLWQEELFGPVAAITSFSTDTDAIQMANTSRYGLGASVWTRSPQRASQFIDKLEAGAIFVNAMVSSDPRLPFGGIKKSGFGRELGLPGLRSFTNVQTVWIH